MYHFYRHTKCRFARSLTATLFAGLGCQAARAQKAPPAPDPTRIVIECEDMKGVDQKNFGPGKAWQVGRWGHDLYQNMTFGGVWASRLRVAMTDASDAPASAASVITVPTAGIYKIWAKYEAPPNFNYAFGIRVEPLDGQGGAGYDRIYGLLNSPKHFCFTDDLTRGSLYWSWGMDHDAAEGYEAKLEKGRYRVTLYKTANPYPAGARSVDTILITSDLSKVSAPRNPRYPLLDELRRDNKVYFRFRNLSKEPIKVAWNHWNHRYPDFYEPYNRDLITYYDASGKKLPAQNKSGDWPDPIPAGGTGVWYDLGPTMNTESSSPFILKALQPKQTLDVKTPGASLPFAVDIALEPNEKRIVKSFALGAGETELNLLVQPDLNHKEGVEYTQNISDVYRTIIRELDTTPRVGPIPKKMMFFGGTGGPRFPATTGWDFELAQQFRHALGLNTVGNNFSREYLDAVVKWWEPRGGVVKRSLSYHHSQDPQAAFDYIKKTNVEDYFYYLSYGDEIGLPHVDAKDAAKVATFQAYVKSQGETPESLGLQTWDQVKPLDSLSSEVAVQIGVLPQSTGATAGNIDKLKRLYWYSVLFRVDQGIESFAEKTKQMKTLTGNAVYTTANLGGMHPFFWMHQSSFIDSFKGNAMSLAWSEDYTYCQPEASRLVVDFEASYLRKGASYNNQRMMFYCMPHYPGNSPEKLIHNAVLLWANNVKDLDWFVACPDIWSTENYVTYRGGLPIWQAMRTISGMAGAVEDDLMPARPDKTPVAMLLSESSDIWELEGKGQGDVTPATPGKPASVATNISQEERKNQWNALRLAGYRVDFVTERDVKDGLLKNYKTLYVSGQNLDRKAAAQIKEWVAGGGVLFATAGAARKDQFDEPLTALDEVLGRGAATSYNRFHGPLRARLELLFEKPLDTVTYNQTRFDALCSKESFTPLAGAQTLAAYGSDGSPAFVKHAFGKGQGYYTGTLPGQAYVKTGLPVRPMGKGGDDKTNFSHYEATDYDHAAAAMILRPLAENGLHPDVTTSRPGVVAGRLSSERSTVVPLANILEQHNKNLKNFSFTLSGWGKKPAKVWSCYYQTGLAFKQDGDKLTVTLPSLKVADVVVIDH